MRGARAPLLLLSAVSVSMSIGCAKLVVALGGGGGESIPGDLTRFDPVARAPAMRGRVGAGYALQRLQAFGVRLDGTVNMKEERFEPKVDYSFVRAEGPPADQPPLGAGGSIAREWHRDAHVDVSRPGGHETWQNGSQHGGVILRGVLKSEGSPSPGAASHIAGDPRCPLSKLWDLARTAGAPADAVAAVDYDDTGYELTIQGTQVRVRLDADCAPRR